MKTVKVGDRECVVETLREWLNYRITSMRCELRHESDLLRIHELGGRLVELLIIREKINDGRIEGIE